MANIVKKILKYQSDPKHKGGLERRVDFAWCPKPCDVSGVAGVNKISISNLKSRVITVVFHPTMCSTVMVIMSINAANTSYSCRTSTLFLFTADVLLNSSFSSFVLAFFEQTNTAQCFVDFCCSVLRKPVAPAALQVILVPAIGQFREFESPRVHTRINS